MDNANTPRLTLENSMYPSDVRSLDSTWSTIIWRDDVCITVPLMNMQDSEDRDYAHLTCGTNEWRTLQPLYSSNWLMASCALVS
jgi:hypothetical protein